MTVVLNPVSWQAWLLRVALSLVAAIVVSVMLAVVLWLVAPEVEPVVPHIASSEPVHVQSYQDELALDALLLRPVFWQGRRPNIEVSEEPIVDVEPQHNTEIEKFTLLGIVAAGPRSFVVIEYMKKKHRLQVEDTLAGWRLIDVIHDAAMFEETGFSEGEALQRALSLPIHAPLPRQWLKQPSIEENISVESEK